MTQSGKGIIDKKHNIKKSYAFWQRFDALISWLNVRRRKRILIGSGLLIALDILLIYILFQFLEGPYTGAILTIITIILLCSILVFSAVVFVDILRMRRRTNSRATEKRLTLIFVMMALVPTVTIASFSAISFNFGLESWFSDRVRTAIDSSYEAANGYKNEHLKLIEKDVDLIASRYAEFMQSAINVSGVVPREILETALRPAITSVNSAFIVDTQGNILARGPSSYLFDMHKPTQNELDRALLGETVIIVDNEHGEFRALKAIEGQGDALLYISREADQQVLSLLNEAEATANFYRESENSRRKLLINFALLFFAISILILLFSIGAAIYYAKRITRPIAKLVRATERVAKGDLTTRLPETTYGDEFDLLSNNFNKMTAEVQTSSARILEANTRFEVENHRFNAVLEGVSSGVIGFNETQNIVFINSAARAILNLASEEEQIQLENVFPETIETLNELQKTDVKEYQYELTIERKGKIENLFLRFSQETRFAGLNYILVFDDVSKLVEAQKLAAWGEVARRIAHEIKNPLTPIRLSAERLRLKYGKIISDEKFYELCDVIIRQTDDLKRIVDEFAKFSRMPTPQFIEADIVRIINDVLTIYDAEHALKISYEGSNKMLLNIDPGLIRQVIVNLVKNAFEAACEYSTEAIVIVKLTASTSVVEMEIVDNGPGWPKNRKELFQPYKSTKSQGTGLGLAIVKKIIEDHNGEIELLDRENQEEGAIVKIIFPNHKQVIV